MPGSNDTWSWTTLIDEAASFRTVPRRTRSTSPDSNVIVTTTPRPRDARGRFISANRPMRVGDRVRVANPAYANTFGGYVSDEFYGAVGTIGSTGSGLDGGHRIDLDGGGSNYIHESYLTLVQAAAHVCEVSDPETPTVVLQVGDTARVGRIAYMYDGHGSIPTRYLGRRVHIIGVYDRNVPSWEVVLDGAPDDATIIAGRYMTFVSRPDAPPTFAVHDRVRIGDPAYSSPVSYGRVGRAYQGRTGLITRVRGDGSYNIRVGGSGTTVVHANWITALTEAELAEMTFCPNVECAEVVEGGVDNLVSTVDGVTGCRRCTQTCGSCDDTRLTTHGSMLRVHGHSDGVYCGDCTDYCGICGTYYLEDEYEEGDCPNVSNHPFDRGVRGYGHTTPSMWLGGPLPRDDKGHHLGYYVGIELEISADEDESAMPIYEWAKKHLGSRDAIQCKYDGSLNEGGFEIVTMPMTPQFFEAVDWESFMDLLNTNHPLNNSSGNEPKTHGLHVHIGRVAFGRDDVATAAYTYLLSQGSHLDRIARRDPYHYCAKVTRPVQVAIADGLAKGTGRNTVQTRKISGRGIYPGRDAINLQNDKTIEIRAFRSTRSANELRDAVRVTYVAAEYIRSLRMGRQAVSPKALHWSRFAAWVGVNFPEAFASIAGIPLSESNRRELVGAGAPVGVANTSF